MGSWVRENTFVCLDDITCKRERINPIIYNPRIITDIIDRKRLLNNYMKEYLNIELSDYELESICHLECSPTYNSSHGKTDDTMLSEFIIKLREIVKSKQK